MGLSGISPLSLLLILCIILAIFGTTRLKSMGSDLGKAVKNFKDAMHSDDNQSSK